LAGFLAEAFLHRRINGTLNVEHTWFESFSIWRFHSKYNSAQDDRSSISLISWIISTITQYLHII